MSKKILFICSTSDFRNHTRRATIEAIGRKNKNASAICLYSFWKRRQARLESTEVRLGSYYFFIPKVLLRNPILNRINYWCNRLVQSEDLRKYDYICFTKPDQYFLMPFFKKHKKIFTVSDPFHLMGSRMEDVTRILSGADHVFATARRLATDYVPNYFRGQLKDSLAIHYWPNCVDTNIWNVSKVASRATKVLKARGQYRLGFAGNFIPEVDLQLLEAIALHFKDHQFILAGKNSLKRPADLALFERIINLPNVEYKGYIPFEQLPAEVYSWDIGLLLDRVDEFGSYLHHNKVYQYLALGKPAIYQRCLPDYEPLHGPVFVANDIPEYIQQLTDLIAALDAGTDFSKAALQLARENSNDARAATFLECLN